MSLNYLIFDHSEDGEGGGNFDAMASVGFDRVAAVQAELLEVLCWAQAEFAHGPGPLEEGFDWDHDLHSQQELTISQALSFDGSTGQLLPGAEQRGAPRYTFSLSLSGSPAFCAALRERFGLDEQGG